MAETPLWHRSKRAILAHGFLRLESAITIGLAIVAIGLFPRPFPFWRWWYWLIIFAIAEVLIVYTSITDERTAEQVIAEMLRQRYNPDRLRVPHLRAQLEQAVRYRQAMERQILTRRQGVLRDRLLDMVARVDRWLAQIWTLAQRLDRLSNDNLVQRDLQEAPGAIAQYRSRLQVAQDARMRDDLGRALASKQAQLANLQELARTMERGQLQLENTISDLGTIYSQVLLLEARDVDSGTMQRLGQDIDEQVKALSDIVSTLDELYQKSAEG